MGSVVHIDTERTWRGGEAQVFHLAKRLPEDRYRSVIAAPKKSALLDRTAAAGFPVIALSSRGEISPRMILDLWRGVSKHQPQILHVHTSHGLIAAGLIRKFSSVKPRVIFSKRTDFPLRTGFMGISLKKHLWSADHILTVSDKIREVMIAGGIPGAMVSTVYSGIDLAEFDLNDRGKSFRREMGIGPEIPLIGKVAALADHKDPMTFIQAAERVVENVPDAVFVLAGGGKMWDALSAYLEQSPHRERIRLLGFRTDVKTILAALDIFCMSSHMEGLCTSVLDAMAMARPVVATRAGGIPEAVGEGEAGILVPVRDPAAMAEAVTALIRDRDKRLVFGKAGRCRAETIFSADITAKKTEGHYDRVLGEGESTS